MTPTTQEVMEAFNEAAQGAQTVHNQSLRAKLTELGYDPTEVTDGILTAVKDGFLKETEMPGFLAKP